MSSSINSGKILKIFGKILILSFIVIGVLISGKFTDFMDAPGLFFVLIGGAAMVLMGFSTSEIGAAFKHAAGSFGAREELRNSAYFWEAAARNFWMLGVLGTVISFIIGLCSSQGGIEGISFRMAESFLTIVYGMILGAICFVPSLKLTRECNNQPLPDSAEVFDKRREWALKNLRFENIIGYALFIAALGWTIIYPLSMRPAEGPLNPVEMFVHWPSLLVVGGGAVALVMFMGHAAVGQSFTLSFAFTGLIGSLMGFVQTLIGFSSRSISDVASAITFIISSCFLALMGMMLIGMPLEDHTVKTEKNQKELALSRIAWYIFPLVTLIFLALTFVFVITPIKKVQ